MLCQHLASCEEVIKFPSQSLSVLLKALKLDLNQPKLALGSLSTTFLPADQDYIAPSDEYLLQTAATVLLLECCSCAIHKNVLW